MTTRTWKVYGKEGHRQRESFRKSETFTTWNGSEVEVKNSDKTGTNDYTVIRITAESAETCFDELIAQIDDGIFENSRVGRYEEVVNEE